MPLSEDDFVRLLLAAAPEVVPILEEHLADLDEVLLHVLVARVRDFAINGFEAGDRELSSRIVAVLDTGLREGDERVENAVAVSFVEDATWWDPDRSAFIASWSPALRAEAERWRSESENRAAEQRESS